MTQQLTSIEQEAVEQFVAQAKAATPEQRQQVVARLQSMIDKRQATMYQGVKLQSAVFAATIEAINAIDAPTAQTVAPTADTAPQQPATTPAGTVRVRLAGGKAFETGLRYAKKVGGRFDPATKTWLIPAGRNELNAPHNYGWVVAP